MGKKRIDERICRDCGRLIFGRRADAIICKDCRRRAQEHPSQKIKNKEKQERILNKVEGSWVERHIEKEKVDRILEALRKGELEGSELLRKDLFNTFGISQFVTDLMLKDDIGNAEKIWKRVIELLNGDCPSKCCEWCLKV